MLAVGRGPRPTRGPHGLPRGFIAHNQRERILDAVATVSAQRGYAELTIPEIARTAGISHHTFYEHFQGKHQAFLATYELGAQQALSATAEAYAAAPDWPHAIHAAVHAVLVFFASEPAFARLCFVEVLAAGPQALAQRDQSLQSFTLLLTPGHQHAPAPVPAIAPEAIGGGIFEILYHHTSNGRTAELPQLAPRLIYIALAPFIGTKAAAKIAGE